MQRINQQLTKTQITFEGTTYVIKEPMFVVPERIATIQVKLYGDDDHGSTELTVEEYLTQQFELAGPNPKAVFKTLRIRWEGEETPTSWVNWKCCTFGNQLIICLDGPCNNTYAIITAVRTN